VRSCWDASRPLGQLPEPHPGKLVRKQLSFPERAIVSALRVPEGDFRDWTEIHQWVASIAEAV
jgi:menaquinone-dependent protoporphyrinogen oxidase